MNLAEAVRGPEYVMMRRIGCLVHWVRRCCARRQAAAACRSAGEARKNRCALATRGKIHQVNRVRYPRLTGRNLLALGVVALSTTAVLAACTRPMPVGNKGVPEPAKPVDLGRYLGLWHEIARYDNSFERGCEAVTAEYALRPDGLIRVLNTCRAESPAGRARSSEGRAMIVPGSGNAKLKVSFFGPFFLGDYWVLDHADDYAWSIVGEPRGKYLWILSRDATPDAETLDMLLNRVWELGYDTALLRMTRQPPA